MLLTCAAGSESLCGMEATTASSTNQKIHAMNIAIISSHKSVTEAVAASGIDFSYNLEAAASEAKDLDRGYRGAGRNVLRPVTEAYVVRSLDTGKVSIRYVLECEEKGGFIRFFNTFSPFCACLSADPFTVLERRGYEFVTVTSLPKNDATRRFLAFACSSNPAVFVA